MTACEGTRLAFGSVGVELGAPRLTQEWAGRHVDHLHSLQHKLGRGDDDHTGNMELVLFLH
jgi:hypothetical protein